MKKYIPILLFTAGISLFGNCSSSDSEATTATTSASTTTATTATPTFTPSVTAFSTAGPHNITIASTTSGSAICYSTTTTPVCNSAKTGCTTGTLYTTAVSVSNATNLKAIACKSGNNDSSVKSVTYTMSSTYGTLSASVTPTAATLDGGTGCITGVNTTMDAALPAWIKDNFKCQTAYIDGTNYVFKSVNLPNHNSFYYCSLISGGSCAVDKRNATLWEALPGGNTSAGTNTVFVQNLEYRIPITPTVKTGSLTSTQGGFVSVGITVNGLAVFNNAAAPPDTLATEAGTFDNFAGHPQNAGVFHHHAAVTKVSTNMNEAKLIGIALDGYAIYDEYCNQGGGAFLPTKNSDTTVPTTATGVTGDSATTLDQLHGHTSTTPHFGTATYHYHYMDDKTATIRTLLGGYFKGTAGTVSN